jgi:hypothetical protein
VKSLLVFRGVFEKENLKTKYFIIVLVHETIVQSYNYKNCVINNENFTLNLSRVTLTLSKALISSVPAYYSGVRLALYN